MKVLVLLPENLDLLVKDSEFFLFLVSRFLGRNSVSEYLLILLAEVLSVREHLFPFIDLIIGDSIVLVVFQLPPTPFLSLIISRIDSVGILSHNGFLIWRDRWTRSWRCRIACK